MQKLNAELFFQLADLKTDRRGRAIHAHRSAPKTPRFADRNEGSGGVQIERPGGGMRIAKRPAG